MNVCIFFIILIKHLIKFQSTVQINAKLLCNLMQQFITPYITVIHIYFSHLERNCVFSLYRKTDAILLVHAHAPILFSQISGCLYSNRKHIRFGNTFIYFFVIYHLICIIGIAAFLNRHTIVSVTQYKKLQYAYPWKYLIFRKLIQINLCQQHQLASIGSLRIFSPLIPIRDAAYFTSTKRWFSVFLYLNFD